MFSVRRALYGHMVQNPESCGVSVGKSGSVFLWVCVESRGVGVVNASCVMEEHIPYNNDKLGVFLS